MGKTVAGEAPMGGSRVIRGPRRWVLLTAVLVLAPAGLAACASASSSTPASSGTPASSSTPATSSTPASSPTPSPSGPLSSFPAYLPAPGEATIVAHGRTPVVTWYGPGKDADDPRTLAEVNNGSDDGWIRQQAQAFKDFGHRIYLRLMPEMNGTWYHGFSGNPAAYVAAWQRIHRLFAQEAVTNVTWVRCPNIDPDDWDQYYPGNSYVDIIGVDGFSNTKYGYQTFEQMFSSFLQHYAGRKPLMIVETATNSGNGDAAAGSGSAASFISGMHSYLKNVAGPRYGLVAVCWFDTDNTDNFDWRVDQTPASWQAWLSLARDPYFGGHGS